MTESAVLIGFSHDLRDAGSELIKASPEQSRYLPSRIGRLEGVAFKVAALVKDAAISRAISREAKNLLGIRDQVALGSDW